MWKDSMRDIAYPWKEHILAGQLESFSRALLEHSLAYLSPERVDYRVVWHQLFNCSKSKEWNAILTLIELLFILPVSNAKVEAFFSLMKRVKTDKGITQRTSPQQLTLYRY